MKDPLQSFDAVDAAFPGCTCREGLEIHHKARRGRFYLRTDTWMVVCRHHHNIIEQNPTWSQVNGYILTQEQRRALLSSDTTSCPE